YALLMIFRFRDELREGKDVESALVETMTHAGRSVIVSGSTVALGLLSLVVLPLPLLRTMGLGGMLIPVAAAALGLLIVGVLAALGTQLNPNEAQAEQLPRKRHRDRRSATARRGTDQPRRDETARRARRAQRQRPAGRGQAAHRAGTRRSDRTPDVASGAGLAGRSVPHDRR
ncbi:MAG TPA: MMPL family transporter, partial [Solirubrobacteraceae bacterium]|nr:MMPL family transporter [Solirubrobacteraceae bacterium]